MLHFRARAMGERHQQKRYSMEAARNARQFVEALLKCAIEMKTEQYLRSKNEQPRLVERGLDALVLRAADHAATVTEESTSVIAFSVSATARLRIASRPMSP